MKNKKENGRNAQKMCELIQKHKRYVQACVDNIYIKNYSNQCCKDEESNKFIFMKIGYLLDIEKFCILHNIHNYIITRSSIKETNQTYNIESFNREDNDIVKLEAILGKNISVTESRGVITIKHIQTLQSAQVNFLKSIFKKNKVVYTLITNTDIEICMHKLSQ